MKNYYWREMIIIGVIYIMWSDPKNKDIYDIFINRSWENIFDNPVAWILLVLISVDFFLMIYKYFKNKK